MKRPPQSGRFAFGARSAIGAPIVTTSPESYFSS
jgi:hypothetical protein